MDCSYETNIEIKKARVFFYNVLTNRIREYQLNKVIVS